MLSENPVTHIFKTKWSDHSRLWPRQWMGSLGLFNFQLQAGWRRVHQFLTAHLEAEIEAEAESGFVIFPGCGPLPVLANLGQDTVKVVLVDLYP